MSDDQKNQELEYSEETENCAPEIKEKIKQLKEKLKECQKEKQEYLTGWQRAQADLINFKRRQENLMSEWLTVSKEEIIKDILPVLDALEPKNHQDEGLNSLKKQLLAIFKKHGLEEIEALDQKFNLEFHEAVEQIESDKEEGLVVEEIQKGYILNGKVIRVAKVKVSK